MVAGPEGGRGEPQAGRAGGGRHQDGGAVPAAQEQVHPPQPGGEPGAVAGGGEGGASGSRRGASQGGGAGTGCGGAGQEGLTGKAGEWRGLEADCLYEVLMQQEEVVEVPSSSSS